MAVAVSRTLYASAARTATVTGDPQANMGHTGVKITVDLTVLAAAETVTPKIDFQDPASGKWVTLLTGAAISGTGTVTLTIYPGVTVAANVAVSDALPATWRVVLTHSSTGAHTYSVGVNLLT